MQEVDLVSDSIFSLLFASANLLINASTRWLSIWWVD